MEWVAFLDRSRFASSAVFVIPESEKVHACHCEPVVSLDTGTLPFTTERQGGANPASLRTRCDINKGCDVFDQCGGHSFRQNARRQVSSGEGHLSD